MLYETCKNAIENVKGSTFVGLDTETAVKLTGGKKNEMQGRVTKVTEGATVMIFNNTDESGYANMVRKRLVNEGKDPETFELKPRQWGTRIPKSPFVEHKGEYYLECIFISGGKSHYLLDGKPIEKEDVVGLPVVNVSEESQGGVDNKVVIRTFKLDSITQMRIRKEVVE